MNRLRDYFSKSKENPLEKLFDLRVILEDARYVLADNISAKKTITKTDQKNFLLYNVKLNEIKVILDIVYDENMHPHLINQITNNTVIDAIHKRYTEIKESYIYQRTEHAKSLQEFTINFLRELRILYGDLGETKKENKDQ